MPAARLIGPPCARRACDLAAGDRQRAGIEEQIRAGEHLVYVELHLAGRRRETSAKTAIAASSHRWARLGLTAVQNGQAAKGAAAPKINANATAQRVIRR